MDVAEPLKGVTVLDFGQVYNGPYCGFLLAQAGARVIKIESTKGETLRGPGRPVNGTYPFATLNRGKECITLNIKKKEGKNEKRKMRTFDICCTCRKSIAECKTDFDESA